MKRYDSVVKYAEEWYDAGKVLVRAVERVVECVDDVTALYLPGNDTPLYVRGHFQAVAEDWTCTGGVR